jgi:hypothetical protein
MQAARTVCTGVSWLGYRSLQVGNPTSSIRYIMAVPGQPQPVKRSILPDTKPNNIKIYFQSCFITDIYILDRKPSRESQAK